ncbi:MAG: SPOR domain-containing protein [Legionellales bacterium]|nr:SPOR domain-containing protein [Legionellales bacterium]
MAKDFGKRRKSHHQGGASKQLLMALIFFLLGYLSASVFDFTSLTHWVNSQILLQQHGKIPPKPAPVQAQLPKPKLEFYTLLASARTEPVEQPPRTIPVTAVTQTSTQMNPQGVKNPTAPTPLALVVTAKQVPMPPPASKEAFLVQIAAFKTRQEAEKMKASLALKGFVISVAVDNPQRIKWYRVCMGPYATRLQAHKAQMAVAKSEHIVGMIRKMQG